MKRMKIKGLIRFRRIYFLSVFIRVNLCPIYQVNPLFIY